MRRQQAALIRNDEGQLVYVAWWVDEGPSRVAPPEDKRKGSSQDQSRGRRAFVFRGTTDYAGSGPQDTPSNVLCVGCGWPGEARVPCLRCNLPRAADCSAHPDIVHVMQQEAGQRSELR